ncbi:TPA: hypothetical protein ACQJLZ_004418 [Citrobacter freundii]
MTTITREQAQKIIDAADEVITALAGTNEDVHPESDNMLRLWDDLNDRYAPPEVVRELARIALATLEAKPVYQYRDRTYSEWQECSERYYRVAKEMNAGLTRILYTAPPAPVANSYPLLEFVKEYIESWGLGMAGDSGLLASAKQAIADSAIQQPVPVVPATLPCSVELKPGLIIGKGCKTETLLTALQRRADYYAEIDAMTPEERAEHDANIEAFKAMLPQPDIEMLSSALRNAPLAPSDSQGRPRSPVVPEAKCDDDGSVTSDFDHGWNACRAAMLQAGNSPVTPDGWQLVPKEPTQAMNKAGWDAMNEHDAINPTYRAMLEAAPLQAKSQHKKK